VAQVTVTFTQPTADDFMAHLAKCLFNSVGVHVCHKSPQELSPRDVSVINLVAGPGSLSPYRVEIRVELASEDWDLSKYEYEVLAGDIGEAAQEIIPKQTRFYVWVTGGPFTGFFDSHADQP